MHAKYKVSISYGSKANAKVETDRLTGQKQYSPIHRCGHKNVARCNTKNKVTEKEHNNLT